MSVTHIAHQSAAAVAEGHLEAGVTALLVGWVALMLVRRAARYAPVRISRYLPLRS